MKTEFKMHRSFFAYFILLIVIQLFTLAKANTASGNPLNDDSKLTVVVLDAGHGGKDPGAVSANAREKDIVLDITLKLGKFIKTNFPELKVIYTRDKDVFIPLNERAIIANKNNAQLFISIHANWIGSKSVKGTETFTLGLHRSSENLEVAKKENSVILLEDDYETTYEGFDSNQAESYIMFENIQKTYSRQSILFASEIQDQFREKAKRIDRSVKQAGFLVLQQAAMPSVLIETGFISNDAERNYLLSENGKNEIAQAIFNAFRNYKKKFDQRSSFNIMAENEPTSEIPKSVTSENTQNTSTDTAHKASEKESSTQSNSQIVRTINNTAKPKTFNPATNPEQYNPINLYYSVQIGALNQPLDISPSNFKGEKNVFEFKIGKYYKYYCGKHDTYDKASADRERLDKKFKGAFVVAIKNGVVIPVKKALE